VLHGRPRDTPGDVVELVDRRTDRGESGERLIGRRLVRVDVDRAGFPPAQLCVDELAEDDAATARARGRVADAPREIQRLGVVAVHPKRCGRHAARTAAWVLRTGPPPSKDHTVPIKFRSASRRLIAVALATATAATMTAGPTTGAAFADPTAPDPSCSALADNPALATNILAIGGAVVGVLSAAYCNTDGNFGGQVTPVPPATPAGDPTRPYAPVTYGCDDPDAVIVGDECVSPDQNGGADNGNVDNGADPGNGQ